MKFLVAVTDLKHSDIPATKCMEQLPTQPFLVANRRSNGFSRANFRLRLASSY